MKHARVGTPDGHQVIRADGTVTRAWDVDRPVLHLLAELFVGLDTLGACQSPRVSCTATVLSPAAGVQVPRELVVRQPLPNQRYFVAGSQDSRFGLMLPLPSQLPEEVVILLQWRFTDPWQARAVRALGDNAAAVDHVLHLRLRPTERGRVFSTDTSAWPSTGVGPLIPCNHQSYAVLSTAALPAERMDNATIGWNAAGDVLLIDERVEVPGILLSDVWGLTEFDDEQLHEVRQTAKLDPASSDTLAHRANALIEMPAKVLIQAVGLARSISYRDGTVYAGSMAACERHPALLALCEWWNTNAPVRLHRRASLCSIGVRVRDDGEYWNAYYETPNMPVRDGATPTPAARIGDVVLIQFFQGQHAATFGRDGCTMRNVAGGHWLTVGVSEGDVRSGEADEGWYALEGLASFPERFPAAWSWLTADPTRNPHMQRSKGRHHQELSTQRNN